MKMTTYGDVGAVKEEHKGQLVAQIMQLNETCAHIDSLVEQLENTLEPVLRPRLDSIKAGEDVPQQVLVMRADQVRGCNGRLQGTMARLADILDRLEV